MRELRGPMHAYDCKPSDMHVQVDAVMCFLFLRPVWAPLLSSNAPSELTCVSGGFVL